MICDVWRGDGVGSDEVRDDAGKLEHTVEGARRELQALGGGAQEGLSRWLDFAVFAHFGGTHLGIDTHPLVPREAARLALAGGQDALAHMGRGFGFSLAGQLFILDAGNLDVDVNAVEQRAGDALLVAADGAGRAGAGARGVAMVAARAPVRVTIEGIAYSTAFSSERMRGEIRVV